MADKVVVVGGVGDTLGRAIARRFARENRVVALVSRSPARLEHIAAEIRTEGGRAEPCAADMSVEADMVALFGRVEARLGAIEAAVYVAAERIPGGILDTSVADFEKVWRMSCCSGFIFAREAARHMLPRGRGSILFSGSKGSVRGRANFVAFDSAKAGLRHLAQSMARELGPQGVHVATLLMEGAIDSERMRRDYPERMASLGPDDALVPDDLAETFWQIHCQPRNAWTHEVDLRPWTEKF